jgi:hypothetical protein
MDPLRLPFVSRLLRPAIALGLPRRLHADLERLRVKMEA